MAPRQQARRTRMGRALVTLTSLMLLGGCISLGQSKPAGNLIRLTAMAPAAAGLATTALPGEALVVFEPQTDRSLGVTRIPVQISDSAIAYLTGVNWVDHPSRLLRSLLAETIRGRGKRLVFEDDQAEARGNLRLTGRLITMGYDARRHAVVVRYDAMQQLADGTLKSRRFEAVKTNIPAKPNAIAPALNAAANAGAEQVADWVR